MGNNPCSKNEDKDKNRNDDNNDNLEMEKKVMEEPILEIVTQFKEKFAIQEMKLFRKRYKIKKNLKCQKDLFYTLKVIENIRSERLFNAKILKRTDIMNMGLDAFKNFYETEMTMLSIFKHPNVEAIVEIFYEQSRDDFILVIVSTYTTKNSLLDIINDKIKRQKRFEEEETMTIMKILIETFYKLKAVHIIHRNPTPESIFFQRESNYMSLCILNFYCSVELVNNAQSTRGVTGPMWYMAPEVLRDQSYDYKADIWSLGLVFYMLLTLENPFQEATNKDTMLEYLKQEKFFKTERELKNLNISEGAISLLFKMLKDDPVQRGDIEVIINDPYIKSKKGAIENNPFNSLIIIDVKNTKTLQFKIQNNPELHDLVFYLVYCLRDYFLDLDELFLLNEFYKYFDTNNDGIVEFDEVVNMLKNDKYKEEEYLNYSGSLRSILNTEFRLLRTEDHLINSFDYDYFLTANIILNIYKGENQSKTREKIRIMFKELDNDDSGAVSIEEIEKKFSNKYSERNIETILESIKDNKHYTKFPEKQINDFFNLSESDFSKLIRYEIVELTNTQLHQIRNLENREKGVNDSNSKSRTLMKSSNLGVTKNG